MTDQTPPGGEPAQAVDTEPGPVDAAPAPAPAPAAAADEAPLLEDGAPAGPARSNRRRRGVIGVLVAVLVVAAIGGGFWAWSAASASRYEAATAGLQSQLTDERAAARAFDARVADGKTLALRIRAVVDRPEFVADSGAEAKTLLDDLTVLEPLSAAPSVTAPAAEIASSDGAYDPPWQLTTESEQLEGRTRASQNTTSQLVASTGETKAAADAVSTAEVAYFGAVAQGAEQVVSENALSNRSTQVALLSLAAEARKPSMSLSRDGAFLGSIFDAEAGVRSSQSANQAEQDDPQLAVRREIESYARSLSHGVSLEFVWSEEVSGLGSNWLSGTAQTYDTDTLGTYAVINLNFTVEDAWTDRLNETDAHALVAHEVGHTQTYRCATLFADPVIAQDQEKWATAWSISLGYDVPGSGIEAYGRPTDAQIAVAAQCR